MSDKTVPANTPETLGVTPRYVLQHNAISRSAHNFSATAKKLTAMAMALLPADLSNLTVAFTFTEFCKALGYTKSGESFKIFLTALKECLNNVISLEIVSPTTGKKKWENYTWFTASVFDEETGVATMTFSPKFAAALQDLKRVYAKIHLQDLGELQSKYALRIFEMAVSYESLKGKDGNKSESWYFERSIPELRFMFGIPEDAYPETKRFRQKVIEEPVEEINQAGIGVKIKTEGIKQGRRLAALRFNCEKAARTIPAKKRGRSGKKAESQLELPDQNPAKARQEKELEHLKELYPDEFTGLYAQILEELPYLGGGPGEHIRQSAAELKALEALRERHGIVK